VQLSATKFKAVLGYASRTKPARRWRDEEFPKMGTCLFLLHSQIVFEARRYDSRLKMKCCKLSKSLHGGTSTKMEIVICGKFVGTWL
jgi:hypothetical protein